MFREVNARQRVGSRVFLLGGGMLLSAGHTAAQPDGASQTAEETCPVLLPGMQS